MMNVLATRPVSMDSVYHHALHQTFASKTRSVEWSDMFRTAPVLLGLTEDPIIPVVEVCSILFLPLLCPVFIHARYVNTFRFMKSFPLIILFFFQTFSQAGL